MYRQIFLSIILLLCLSCKQEIKTKKVKSLSPVAKVTAFKKLEQSCADCHEEEYKDWRKSHHFKAMAPANDESVLGDFNQQSFTNPQTGLKSLFFKNAKDYIIRTQGDDGELHDFKVLYTYGFKPLQQYIVAFPNGRLQCLHLAWDTEDKKWFHLYPKEKISSGEWLHWSRGGQNWNSMCADCHSTYLEKNFDPVKKSYDSKWEQINVSCQACHEKAKEHDSWQRYQTASDSEKEKASQDAEWLHSGSVDPIISNKKQTAKEQVESCAPCHSRRQQLEDHRHQKFQHTYIPELIRPPFYHPDGQIKDEDYVYGSFVQSKMYRHGVACKDCHNPHSNELKFQGKQLCLQCHDTKKYDVATHHFHGKESTGSQCVNCHMPGKYYMVNDFRRDHSLRIPRPDLTVKYGTPNACNNCHQDQDAQWAAKAIEKHHGEKRLEHFSEVFLAAHDDPTESPRLYKLLADPLQSDLVKATSLWYLEAYPTEESFNWSLRLLKDKSPLVRVAAIRLLASFQHPQAKKHLWPLLDDDALSVRSEASFALSGFNFDDHEMAKMKRLSRELKNVLHFNADFPSGRLRLAQVSFKNGDLKQAEKEYKEAVQIDGFYNTARLELAQLYRYQQRLPEAEKLLLKVLELEDYLPAYKTLSLIYVGQKAFPKAIERLKAYLKKAPQDAEAYYFLAVVYQNMKDFKKSEASYRQAISLQLQNFTLYQGLMSLLVQTNQKEKARELRNEMKVRFPDQHAYLEELNEILD